ncbi:Uncharacterized protein DBV15_10211 [Temnothorax longispinosus]|uniref:F-box/LRR-repeat protein 4 n=1 Tax=Temnothorax longispinosus TaxID=300112 RepID=A0A4S2JBY4_9HYME|nr:Uncharacterized protein DBV15_10211 [Temnothorax longispinosus]
MISFDPILGGTCLPINLKTLCLMNQVNKRFNDLTRDPLLYTRLNMRNICCPIYFYNILCYFTPRCKYLQQLYLTLNNFSSSHFVQFLENCGRHLTHLRFIQCRSKIYFTPQRHTIIERDKRESMEVQCFCKILQKNKRIRELYLHCCLLMGNCSDSPVDTVAIGLGNSCRDLQIINLYDTYGITSKGINALANCKNLQTVDLGEIMESKGLIFDLDDSLSRLLSSCQLLEEIFLTGIVLSDRNLKLLAECKNLKTLHLQDVKFVTPDNVSIILEQCPKLECFQLLDYYISLYLISQWKKSHPHVFNEKREYLDY